ncbi:MAG: hypothetical protein Q7V19_03775 [Bacteroidales bacterium]|nr:hypothetical protein [Bacteroidales bacterium]
MEAAISVDNEVRMIELFVEDLDKEMLGCKTDQVDPEKFRLPAYHPKNLLKLYIYGYMNRIRS